MQFAVVLDRSPVLVLGGDQDVGGALYVDSLSEPGGPVPTYLDLLAYDVDLIVEGLRGE